MDWRVKAIVQGTLSRLPMGEAANDWLQRLAGGRRNMDEHIRSKVRDDWLVHMQSLRSLNFTVQGRDMMEIGTGWLPVMPLCFALAGVRRCYTLDLNRHLRPGAVLLALRSLEPYLHEIAAAAGVPAMNVLERWSAWLALSDGQAVMDAAGIVYRAPADATRCGLPAHSLSLVFSNSVLEHVPEGILDALMLEAARVLAPDGIALHCVNCGDHFAYFDRSITPIHYLRFSEREWRRWNNALLYQNRLRPVDFVEAASRAGLEVLLNRFRPRPELLQALPGLPIAPEFRHYPPDQLCATSIDFAARPLPAL